MPIEAAKQPSANSLFHRRGDDNIGRSNYIGLGEQLGIVSPNSAGVFTNRSSVSLAQSTNLDRTSNTAMFGETLGDSDARILQFANNWIGFGSPVTDFCLGSGPESSSVTFASKHIARLVPNFSNR